MGRTGGAGRQPFPRNSSSTPRNGSQQKAEHPGAPSASPDLGFCFSSGPSSCPIPTPHKDPRELRLRRRSCPEGHGPHVWEKKYTPLNTEHIGEGGTPRERERQATQELDGPSPQPAQRRCFQRFLKKEENHTTEGRGRRTKALSHLYTTL